MSMCNVSLIAPTDSESGILDLTHLGKRYGLSYTDTHAKLIDPALYSRGWMDDLIRCEETDEAVDVVDRLPHKRAKVLVDYIVRGKITRSRKGL